MSSTPDKSPEGPYSTKPLQLLPGHEWVTLNGEPVIRGRADQSCDSFPTGQALRIRNELNAAYAAGQAAGWISVEERLPEQMVEVIVSLLSKGGIPIVSTAYYGAFEHDADENHLSDYERVTWRAVGRGTATLDHYTVTHWQSLPPPPDNTRP